MRAATSGRHGGPGHPSESDWIVVMGDLPPDVVQTLGITLVALALFLWNRLDAAVVGLIVMALLIAAGLVTPREGLSGFANEATVKVALMLALSIGHCSDPSCPSGSRW